MLIDGGSRFPRDDDVSTCPVPLSVDLRSLVSLVAPDALFGQVLSLTWVLKVVKCLLTTLAAYKAVWSATGDFWCYHSLALVQPFW